jgi:2-polyprenyl-3-methyl-5-hydroxy-6-metoxy-1,4-benzoquinol methylase
MDWNPQTHYQNPAVAKRYDNVRFSGTAGRIFNRLEKSSIVRAFAGVSITARILDLPCGTGRLAEPLLEAGYSVVGVDISAPMLEVASARLARFGGQFTSLVCDVHAMPDRQERYDAAMCARVLMHFPLEQQIEFLRSISKVTLGYVVFTQSLSTPYQRFRRRIKRWIGNPAPAAYPITETELRRLLEAAGLVEARRIRPMPLLTEEIIVVARHAGSTSL